MMKSIDHRILHFVGTYCCLCHTLWSHMLIQWKKGDCIQGKRDYKLEDTSDFILLFLWDSSWHGRWITWARRRVYLGTSFSWTGNSTSGMHLLFSIGHQKTLKTIHFTLTKSFISFPIVKNMFPSWPLFPKWKDWVRDLVLSCQAKP